MCNWKPGEIILTYDTENRQGVLQFLGGLPTEGFQEQWEMFNYLSSAGVTFESPEAKPKFTLSLVKVPDGEEFEAAATILRAIPNLLLSVEPNHLFTTALIRPVQKFNFNSPVQRAYHQLVGANIASGKGITGQGAVVAVLDTGIEGAGRTDVAGAPHTGINFISPCAAADDDHGHGTAIASIIDDVAPNVVFYPIKIANSVGKSDLWLLEAGLLAARAASAPITNISMQYGVESNCPSCGAKTFSGGHIRSHVLDRTVGEQSDKSCVVAAAGNGGLPSIAHPAACPKALPVASINQNQAPSGFSNYDPNGSYYLAPGGDGPAHKQPTEFVGTDPGTGALHAGTSMAAGYASGVLALFYQEFVSGSSYTSPSGFPTYVSTKVANRTLICFT
jgi:subtilisin family serine protease